MLRIFTDTAANVPPHLLEQYHITAMPLTYLLDGQPTELVGHDYYEAMRKGAEVKTSLVSPALIRDTMESALKDGIDLHDFPVRMPGTFDFIPLQLIFQRIDLRLMLC